MRSSVADWIWLTGLAGALLGLGSACMSAKPESNVDEGEFAAPPALSAPAAGDGLSFALSGNERGFIRPCGCSKPKLGGIHRRATALAKWRAENPALITLGLGNMTVGAGPQARIKFEHFFISMMVMEYRAFFPGPGELLLGKSFLAQQKSMAAFPLVSLNVVDGAGAPVFDRSHRLEGSPWVLTGLNPETAGLADLVVQPWGPALEALFAELNPEEDRLLIAWNGDEKAARTIASAVPESWRKRTIIVLGGGYDAPVAVAGGDLPVPMYSVGSKGRNLTRLSPAAEQPLFALRLEESIEAMPDVAAILDGYRMALSEAKLIERVPRSPSKITYVGDESCRECHEEVVDHLLTTPHQHAWKTLVDYGDHDDPECASCHVTGWGEVSGFFTAEKTPKQVNVNCEACHGPGHEHVEFGETMPRARPNEQFCRRCHDPDNSPKFDYAKYWPKIAHPKK